MQIATVEVAMTIRRTIFGTAAAVTLGIAANALGAQSTAPPHKPTTPVIAGIARAPDASHGRDRDRDGDREHDRRDEHHRGADRDRFGDGGIRVGHLFFGPEIPVIVGSDGHVYANFGYGFQPVLQNCGSMQYSSLSGVPAAVPSAAPTAQPQVTQPVVVQPGAAPSPNASGSAARLAEAPSTMCWATDERGQLRVGRR